MHFKNFALVVLAVGITAVPLGSVVRAQDAAANARKIELAKRYMVSVDMEKTIDAVIASTTPMIFNQYLEGAGVPTDSPEGVALSALMSDVMRESAAVIMPRYIDSVAVIFADALTTEELMEMVEFYESPTGRSVTRKTPALTPAVAGAMQKLIPEFQQEIVTRLCSKIDCAPAEKARKKPA